MRSPKKHSRQLPDKSPTEGWRLWNFSPKLAATFILGAALTGFIVRFYGLGQRGIWIDEANTYVIVRESLNTLFARLAHDSSPPLYYLLLQAWIELFGTGLVAMRSLSVLFSVSLIAAAGWFGSYWISHKVGVYAAWLIACMPDHVLYAQQVRMYALLGCMFLWSTHMLLQLLESRSTKNTIVYAVSLAATALTHNFGLYLIPAHILIVAMDGSLLRNFKQWTVVAIIGLAIYLPWLPKFLHQANDAGTYAWFEDRWSSWVGYEPFLLTFNSWSAEGWLTIADSHQKSGAWPHASAWLLISLTVFGCLKLPIGKLRRSVFAVIVVSFAPVLMSVVLSHLWVPHYVPWRLNQALVPTICLLAAFGLESLRPQWLVFAIWFGVLGVGAHHSWNFETRWTAKSPIPTDQELAAQIRRELQPGDVLLFTSLSHPNLEFALGDLRPMIQTATYPEYNALHMGGVAEPFPPLTMKTLPMHAEEVLNTLLNQAAPQAKLYAFLLAAPVVRPLWDVLHARKDLIPIDTPRQGRIGGSGRLLELHTYRIRNEIPRKK